MRFETDFPELPSPVLVPAVPPSQDGLVLVHDAEEGDKEAELERWHEVFGERAAAELDANFASSPCAPAGASSKRFSAKTRRFPGNSPRSRVRR